jgi:membrane-anchored protein YejM (alkaline phosphatase superfamily)
LGKDKLIFGGDDVGVDVKVLLSLSLLFEWLCFRCCRVSWAFVSQRRSTTSWSWASTMLGKPYVSNQTLVVFVFVVDA